MEREDKKYECDRCMKEHETIEKRARCCSKSGNVTIQVIQDIHTNYEKPLLTRVLKPLKDNPINTNIWK